MDARNSKNLTERLCAGLLITLLACGLWQAYGAWLFDSGGAHVR